MAVPMPGEVLMTRHDRGGRRPVAAGDPVNSTRRSAQHLKCAGPDWGLDQRLTREENWRC